MADKVPTVMFEILAQGDSGFILDGTRDTPNEQQLRTPEVTWIPNSGYRGVWKKLDGIDTLVYEEIRYIKNSLEISKEEQDKKNIKPNHRNDKLEIKRAEKLTSRQGDTINEYDYMTQVFYNQDAPNRPAHVQALYRAVDVNKNAEILNDDDEFKLRALQILSTLRTKIKNNEYQYNEERVEAICTLLSITAESNSTKYFTISSFANAQPKAFLQKVENFEQMIETEVNHASQMNVVVFDGNTAILNSGEEKKIIKDLGAGKLGHNQKMQRLSDYLKTQDGNNALTEIRLLTRIAKDQALQ